MPHLNLAKEMAPIYNVDSTVGSGCPNQRGDVFLVQYFIKTIYDRTKDRNYKWEIAWDDVAPVDGHFTSETPQWIFAFQQWVNRQHNQPDMCVLDRRVDPAVRLTGGLQHRVYTILHLNIWFQRLRPGDHANLTNASDCPPEILKSFVLG
jgi:hypothetical protein